ncbi:Gfo/Idh/MocA family oxidoreductase [Rhodocaloribacter litoris]|uniref:Gfo/Idh/MocA family protein n=1 Tax=Rhodocaloribacter litoris TaxID=2558931 RepID=UPI0014217952|nr:Gfo/Idh/MocA family oxidoreductase [Rhodocaloribacter litoris]QXD14164.1 Gfo/Idh/MocA family oxidoreductase [Rhodocaloribacter litoris]
MSDHPPLRLGQVGIGYWGKNLLRNFAGLPDVTLAWACDQREDVLAAVARQYPEVRTTHRFEDLLEDPALDAVVIATETPRHFPMAEAALQAGKHVFVEKPMAQTAAEAERLVELAETHDRRLMVGHLLLYHPAFEYVANLIRRGELGEVYYLYSMRVNLGIVRQAENAFESLAPHDLAVALAFLDRRPVAVSAQGQAYLQPGIEDVAFATIYFEDGKLAHLHTSWLDPHKIRKVTVVGSRKMAVIDDVESVEKVRLYDKGIETTPSYTDYAGAMTLRSGDIHIPRIDMQEPLLLECRHFVECVRTGRTPRTDGRNGLAVVRLMEAALRSLARNGACIDV